MGIDFITRINNYIADRHLFSADDTILVGLSGGADSVALLGILNELGYRCIATHCNFHLRGDESNRDENFCRNLCHKLSIKLLVTEFDVENYRSETGDSVEMACRTLRYDWWNSLIKSGVGTILAVGHHKEDNIETFFINMLRGCGLGGLKGMLPKTGNVVRPLLDVSRSDIEKYLADKHFDYVTDSTNLSNDYGRNKLRNIILPELERQFPGAAQSISKTIACLQGNYELYTDSIEHLRRKYVTNDNGINLSAIVTGEPHPSMTLFELLSPIGFNMTQVSNILSAIDNDGTCHASGRHFSSPVATLLLDRGYLRQIGTGGADGITDAALEVTLSTPPFSSEVISKDEFFDMRESGLLKSDSIYLDASILDSPHTYILRNWRNGDRFKPFGMNGSKLLSDLFNDIKLSVAEKSRVPVLLCDDMIIWVVGIRASRLFPVTPKTENVLIVTYNPEK